MANSTPPVAAEETTDRTVAPAAGSVDGSAMGSALIGRAEACGLLGIRLRTFVTWEADGRLPGGQWGHTALGQRCRLYPAAAIVQLRETIERQFSPFADPQRAGVWCVPVTSRLHEMVALIDADALPLVHGRRWNWSPGKNGGMGLVVLAIAGSPRPSLHQIIMGVAGREHRVSHLNGDPLDCRRENLIVRTQSEQASAARKAATRGGRACSSRYKGVCWIPDDQKWTAVITVRGRCVQLGQFRDEVLAALAYDDAARELSCEHARLNFPHGVDPAVAAESAARAAALEPAPVPSGMVDRYEGCRMFGISLTTWMHWEKKGRIACHRWFPLPSGKAGRCKLYPVEELERLREEISRLGKPYADADQPGCWRVPLRSYLCYREAIIDAADLPVVQGRNWNWGPKPDGVAGGSVLLATVSGPHTPLQRLIMGVMGTEARVCFANGDPLDCRRANLIVRTIAEQVRANRKMGTMSGRKYTSDYKGVCWDESRGKWLVQISCGEVHRHLGRFDDELAAAEAYDEAARELFGEHARLNFPGGIDAALNRAA